MLPELTLISSNWTVHMSRIASNWTAVGGCHLFDSIELGDSPSNDGGLLGLTLFGVAVMSNNSSSAAADLTAASTNSRGVDVSKISPTTCQ